MKIKENFIRSWIIAAFLWGTFGLGLFIGGVIVASHVSQIKQESSALKEENIKLTDSITNILTFTPENVQRYLEYFNVPHSELVYSQILLETGHFCSDAFKTNNNLFGMRYPKKRATTAIKEHKGYAYYDNYIQSIKDYKIFLDTYYNDFSYLKFLEEYSYAVDSLYTIKIKYLHARR